MSIVRLSRNEGALVTLFVRGLPLRGRWGLVAAWFVLCGVACAPAYNWREVTHEGTPLRALLPCKPERAQRQVPLLGPERAPVTLHMMSCPVNGDTFAVAVLTLPTPDLVDEALRRWREATWASLKVPASTGAALPDGWSEKGVSWPGASTAVSWSGVGTNHLNQPLDVQFWLGAQGARVVQAAWYGKSADPEVRETFFAALRFDAREMSDR